MKRILVINGPNLNLLGVREPDVYGSHSYDELVGFIMDKAASLNLDVKVLQSNHEGAIVDMIQQALDGTDAIVINPAAYTHTSVAILDALKAVGLPTVEVHLSDINCREEFRRFSYVSLYAEKTISGMGFDGYAEALEYLAE
ncbi:MAG: type II 3-dehydroquinate dehydratase [Bacteroidaceae bacterium]|nr:type II 3-dehydroquinate dehydratase [Bacteroidaceae bacterium]